MRDLSNLFGGSPFKFVRDHHQKVAACLATLAQLLKAREEGDRDGVHQRADEIFALETEADGIRNDLHKALASKLLLPVPKSELFNLVEHQDSVADCAEDLAAIFTYKELPLPSELTTEIDAFVQDVLTNCRLCDGIFDKLDLLVESSFAGRDALTTSKLIVELKEKDDQTKAGKIALTRALYRFESAIGSSDLRLWSQVIEHLANLSKFSANSADVLHLIIESN